MTTLRKLPVALFALSALLVALGLGSGSETKLAGIETEGDIPTALAVTGIETEGDIPTALALAGRGAEVIIPSGGTVIEPGDHVLVVATKNSITQVERLLARRKDL